MPSTIARDLAPKFWETVHTDGAVLPSDPPWCHASGSNPYRVLLVGGRAAMGYGLHAHERSVGGGLTAVLASLTDCGAETDIVARAEMSIDAAVDEVSRRDLRRYSAVVLVIDAAVAVGTPQRLGEGAARVADGAAAGSPAPLPVILAVAPPLPAGLCGASERPPRPARMEAVSQALDAIASRTPRALGILLPDTPQPEAEAIYAEWGRTIATALVPRLARWDAPHAAIDPVEPERRQAAVERLGLLDGSLAEEFRRIVDYARLAYGTRSAAFSVFTEGDTWFMTRRGFDVPRLPEGETVSAAAAALPAGLILGDARLERRFRDRAGVREGTVAFYAGYRVESPDGQPIGALCVFDPQPRTTDPEDLALLRDFALAAQRRLWALAVRRAVAR